MAETFAKSKRPRRLSELLADGHQWPLKDGLLLVQRLARQVQALHQQRRTHRAIDAGRVRVDEKLRAQLGPPAGPRRFGADENDPDFCPPELAGAVGLELPEGIEAATAVLQKSGHTLDPRRIDIYQLGTLLCRLLTGESILAYMYDPMLKPKVPAPAGALLDRALGHDAANRFEDCDGLIAALDEAVRQAESVHTPTSLHETPAQGSVIVPDGDTPAQGSEPAPALQAADGVPLEQLGHYRILERIGSGGMGDVYRGYDESLDRQVAIKVLPAELARDKDFVRRFHAEATAAAKVSHPNVVPVYFSGEDGGYHFFAMQFVEGETLGQRLTRQRRIPPGEALEIAVQCLAGLEAAHAQELIHRDIKPGNILIDRETGRAVLVDFGLVRRIDQSARLTATGMIMGTVDYIAPEQARGHKVDGRADIYSLGVLFYHCLAGRLPFEGDTLTAMIYQHAYEEPAPLLEAAPEVPQPVAEIIGRMMAKEPDRRYQTCSEVLADLRAFREGRPVAAAAPVDAGPRPTTILPAPEPAWDPELPAGLAKLASDSPWQRARDWVATMFRRRAPEFVQQLQSTTQQVDGAVALYERRRNWLARLQEEARSIAAELAEQIDANREAAAAAREELGGLWEQDGIGKTDPGQ